MTTPSEYKVAQPIICLTTHLCGNLSGYTRHVTTTSDPSLGWSIGVLFRSWQEGAAQALAGLPHGARGFQILATVAHDEPPTQASLAAHLGIDRTVLTYVLDDLVEAGVLERTVDPADRRVRRLAATASGRELLAELEQRVADAERELWPGSAMPSSSCCAPRSTGGQPDPRCRTRA